MPEIVQFHFLMLAAGEILKVNRYVSAQKIQEYIVMDEAFGVRVPLDQCRLALSMLESSGFIKRVGAGEFEEYEKAAPSWDVL